MSNTDKQFTFDEKQHLYFFEGKPMTGVTTILGYAVNKPNLIQWAADMAVDYIRVNSAKVVFENGIYTVLDDELEEARFAHKKKKEDAGSKGTDIHALLETIIKEAIATDGFITGHENEEPQVSHFIEWALKNNVKFLESEKRVYSETHWYAGTLDFMCEIDGKVYVGDIKTSNGIYGRSYFAQCAAYRLALEEMGYGLPIEGSIIVRVGKDGKFDEEKDAVYSNQYNNDKKYFLSALEIYRQENA